MHTISRMIFNSLVIRMHTISCQPKHCFTYRCNPLNELCRRPTNRVSKFPIAIKPKSGHINTSISFQDILFNSTSEQTYTMSLHDSGNAPTLRFAPQKKRSLTETEWCTAWDEFLAVYTQKPRNDLSDLITYSRHIKDLMQSGADWRY